MKYFIAIVLAFACLASSVASAAQDQEQTANSTSITRKLFTYTGPLLPPRWSLVSVLNDRVVIGFDNGTARNAALEELEPKDQVLIQRLQNGTLNATPLASAKEKLSQWSSSVTSTVSKFGKSVKEQFDSLLNNNNKTKPAGPEFQNFTSMFVN